MIPVTQPYKKANKSQIGYVPFYIKLSCWLPACKTEKSQISRAIARITSIPNALADIVSRYNKPIHENALKRLVSGVSPMRNISNIESDHPRQVQNNIFILLSKIADTTGYPQPSKSTCYPRKIIELARSISEYDSWEEAAEQWAVADIFYQILTLGWTGIAIDFEKIERAYSYKSSAVYAG